MPLPKSVGKLPKTFRGAAIVRGLGMDAEKLDDLIEKKSLDQFDATKDGYLVVSNDALEDDMGVEVRCFADEATALRVARALSQGNVDHRVLRVTKQTLVVATMNDW